jgi:uncharacterized protein
LEIIICGETFTLCPEKCMIRQSDNSLIIADLHFGKSNHFRKAGIAVPNIIALEEIKQFIGVVEKYNVDKVIFLGDLFHSSHNVSVDLLHQVLENEEHRKFVLVEGNHDIMRKEVYSKIGIEVVDEIREENGLLFTHEPKKVEGYYNIYGHIHPGVNLVSKGKQSMRLPCFYIAEDHAILPAFGLFTGLAMVKKGENSKVYVVAEEQVILV